MKKGTYPVTLFMLLGCVLFTPMTMAQGMSQYSEPGTVPASPGTMSESYGTTFGRKLGSGSSNMAMGWIEIPKNTLNLTNDIDTKYVLFGLVGGIIKGTLHTIGRTLTGVGDFVTSPVPTKPMIRPNYVWDQFGEDTTYGPYFQLTDPPGNAE